MVDEVATSDDRASVNRRARIESWLKKSYPSVLLGLSFCVMLATFSHQQNSNYMRVKNRNIPSAVTKKGNEAQQAERDLAWYPGDTKAAWFMSFPESGAPYFLHLMHMSSGLSTATNFGHLLMRSDGSLYLHENQDSVEIYENGPALYTDWLPHPKEYIATRTHGTGYCLFCHPKEYFYTDFFWGSAKGTKILNGKRAVLQYNAAQVDRMIHIVRDPFDNVVARFYSWVSLMRISQPNTVQNYPLDANGFKSWCQAQDKGYEKVEMAWLPQRVRDIAKDVPCRQEFIKYARWHNNAFLLNRNKNIDTIIVKYEEYVDDMEKTVTRVNAHLNLPLIRTDMQMRIDNGIHNFKGFYSDAEVKATTRFLRNLVFPSMWYHMQHYESHHYSKWYSGF